MTGNCKKEEPKMPRTLKYVALAAALAAVVTGLNVLQHADAGEAGPLARAACTRPT